MAVVLTVNPAGGADFTSMSAALAALPVDSSDPYEIICSTTGGAPDTSTVNTPAINTSETYSVTVRPAEDHQHGGVWDDTKYHINTNAVYNAVYIDTPYITFEGIQARNGRSTSATAFNVRDGRSRLSRCIGYTPNATDENSIYYTYSQAGANLTPVYDNCIAIGSGTSSGFYAFAGATAVQLANCTAANCGKGYADNYSNISLSNCLAVDCTVPHDGFGGRVSNFVSLTSADLVPGTYQPLAVSAASGAGANLYSDFQTDAALNARPASDAWDVGALVAQQEESSDVLVSLSGSSGSTGYLSVSKDSAISVSGQSSSSGTISVIKSVVASLSGNSGSSSTVGVEKSIPLSLEGQSESACVLDVSKDVQVSLAGESGSSGTIVVYVQIDGSVSVSLSGQSGSSGFIQVSKSASVSLSGESESSGYVDVAKSVAVSLFGESASISSCTVSKDAIIELHGSSGSTGFIIIGPVESFEKFFTARGTSHGNNSVPAYVNKSFVKKGVVIQ